MSDNFPELGGYVTSPKGTIKNMKIDPYGLFSEQIFGPINNYTCSQECKNYRDRSIYEKQKCPKCGVICDTNELRYDIFGKINLTFPCYHPTKRQRLLKILGNTYNIILNTKRADYLINTERYIGINNTLTEIKMFDEFKHYNGFLLLPLNITGIYSLYLCLKVLAKYIKVDIAEKIFDNTIMSFLYVIPPSLRALYYDAQTKVVRTPPINKFYTTILIYERTNTNIRTHIKNDEDYWTDEIIKRLQITDVDQYYSNLLVDPTIIEYDIKASKYQYYIDTIYQWYNEELSGKTGLIRGSVLGKNVDFSARAVIRCDPSLPTYKIKVSKDILYTLWKPYFMHYLTNIQQLDYDYCYDKYMVGENKDGFQEFLDWFCESEETKLQRLVFLNRPPTLWAHSIPCVEIIPDIYNTIALSTTILEMMNADLDGDQLALFMVHDIDALKEMEKNAFVKNVTKYQSDNGILSAIRHEALYAAYVLSSQKISNIDYLEIDNLQILPESDDFYDNKLGVPVKFENKIYSYGICLLNKWAGFYDDIKIDFLINKKTSKLISEKILEDSETSEIYYNRLTELNKRLLYFISSTNHVPSLSIDDMLEFVKEDSKKIFKNLPTNNILVGYNINKAIVERCIENCNPENTLLRLYKSGSRVNVSQLAKICINTGYVSDDNNKIVSTPITTHLLSGFSEEEFARGASGSRKGIGDKSKATPDSGYMERSLAMALSPLEIDMDDCGTNNYLETEIMNEKHAETLVGKNYLDNNVLKTFDLKTAISLIGKTVKLRSPMMCINPNFKMCRKCFGERYFVSKYIGIIAAQSISERLTQLTMQTFHTSGAANIKTDPSVISFIKDHLINVELNNNLIICEFNSNNYPQALLDLYGFEKQEHFKIIYRDDHCDVYNDDVVSIINGVNQLLVTKETTKKSKVDHPAIYYKKMMEYILSVGTPYSSFVEMVFTNMFITNKKNEPVEFWRYNQDKEITKKLRDKNMAINIDPSLGTLFQPNKNTLSNFNFETTGTADANIYFKLSSSML